MGQFKEKVTTPDASLSLSPLWSVVVSPPPQITIQYKQAAFGGSGQSNTIDFYRFLSVCAEFHLQHPCDPSHGNGSNAGTANA